MNEDYQRTLSGPFDLHGIGLHTGAEASVRVSPLGASEGIRFKLQGLAEPFIADVHSVQSLERCTTIGRDGYSVCTVEHLLSALSGCGVDNCLVEVDGPEVPAMDGSALPFVEQIQTVGTVQQTLLREPIWLDGPIWISDGSSEAMALPAEMLWVTYAIDFPDKVVKRQVCSYEVTPEVFGREIAPARTFGFMRDVEELRRRGLALGGGLHNAVVVGDDGYLGPVRFENEPVRHKALDLLGDLALLGAPLRARIIVLRGSHRLHVEMSREVLKRRRT
ncbi:MAG: UDP-3-O-acyl-N-acetylglucosamine deacetylase [Armatimonadota bacterium]|nr:UDP-3-O-acyl-N-acetylglucosamine deacetylase [Armatimonadota bacterium]